MSKQEVDQLRAAERNAQAAEKSARAALASAQPLDYTRITAPIAGRLSRAEVTPGNLVGVGEPVLTNTGGQRHGPCLVRRQRSDLPKRSQAMRAGGPAPTVAVGLANEEGLPHTGTVDFVDNRLNPATGSIRVRAILDNKDGRFMPGLSARVRLASGAAAPATLVPERAIGTDQTRKVVIVVGAKNIVTPREVQLGPLRDGMRVVTGAEGRREDHRRRPAARHSRRAGDAAGAEGRRGACPSRRHRRMPALPAAKKEARGSWTSPASSSTGRALRRCCRSSSS